MLTYAAEGNDVSFWTYPSLRFHPELDENVWFRIKRIIEGDRLAHLQVA
jgi:hypothetical protein